MKRIFITLKIILGFCPTLRRTAQPFLSTMSPHTLQSFRSRFYIAPSCSSSILLTRTAMSQVKIFQIRNETCGSSPPQYVSPVTEADVVRLLKTGGGNWALAKDGLGLQRDIYFWKFDQTKVRVFTLRLGLSIGHEAFYIISLVFPSCMAPNWAEKWFMNRRTRERNFLFLLMDGSRLSRT